MPSYFTTSFFHFFLPVFLPVLSSSEASAPALSLVSEVGSCAVEAPSPSWGLPPAGRRSLSPSLDKGLEL